MLSFVSLKPNQILEDRKEIAERILKTKASEGFARDKNETNYFTQYKRTHDYLGHKLGPGEPREYPDRKAFNVLSCN
jgi:hypothetical protein